jgi:hypothetical protein
MHANEVYPYDMHAHKTHAYEMHAYYTLVMYPVHKRHLVRSLDGKAP